MLRTIRTTPVGFPLALVALALGLTACAPPPAKMVANTNDDGVPANSASEQRLASEAKAKTPAPPEEDAAQPYTTPVSGEPSSAKPGTTSGSGKGGGKGGGKGPTAKEPKGAKVTKAECRQTFNKFMDLNMEDPRLEGLPPEMIAQLKSQALSEAQSKGGDPCSTQEITRAQYSCAMGAPTAAAWQRCMK